MQHPDYQQTLPRVDRVVVHLEQLSAKHKYTKEFALRLGRRLQQPFSVNDCVVKLSQPHVHRSTGPMFKLGREIRETCNLQPAVYASRKRQASRLQTKPAPKKRKRRRTAVPSDVEPDSTSDSDTAEVSVANADDNEYIRKKQMSAAVFQYFINSTREQQVNMQIDVSERVQLHWRQQVSEGLIRKFDDLGDALLHALDEVLCGSSNYRPLVPSTPSLRINRSVVLSVKPSNVYWAVIQCTWNVFTLSLIHI